MSHDSFSERVHEAVYSTYNGIKGGGKPQSHEWTVLAAMLAERDDELEVIALTTGTKSVTESQLSREGLVVNDCHAEVLCRRATIYFLMTELEKCQDHKENAYLEQIPGSERWRIKEGVKLHMYVSQTPCGIASEYSKEGGKREAVELFNVKQRKSKRVCLDDPASPPNDGLESMHLSGAKFGTDPVRLSTKPGRGEHSRSYSCSDKICLWNHIGIQGAALSLLLDPVYVSSIIISGDMDEQVVRKALSTRLVVPDLPSPFRKNEIRIIRDSRASPLCETEVMKKLDGKKLAACGSSLIWIAPSVHETLIARSGVRLGTNVKKGISEKNMSVLSPLALFRRFKELHPCEGDYASVKENAEAYRTAKQRLMDASLEYSMKEWKRKDRVYYRFAWSV